MSLLTPELFAKVYWLKIWQFAGVEAEPWETAWPVFESASLTIEPCAVFIRPCVFIRCAESGGLAVVQTV